MTIKKIKQVLKNKPLIMNIITFFRDLTEIKAKNKLLRNTINIKNQADPKKILFWCTGGLTDSLNIDATIAVSLKARGHIPHIVLCDGTYTACVKRTHENSKNIEKWKLDCKQCKYQNTKLVKAFGLSYSYIGDWISQNEIQHAKKLASLNHYKLLQDLMYENIKIGPHIKSSIIRYLEGYELEPNSRVLYEYSLTGYITTIAAKNCIKKNNFYSSFMSHGVYVDWGTALKVCIQNKIETTVWISSYLYGRLSIGKVKTLKAPTVQDVSLEDYARIQKIQLTEFHYNQLNMYFKKMYGRPLMDYSHHQQQDIISMKLEIGLDTDLPVWGIFAHVNWDAVSDRGLMLYDSFNKWIIETINIIKEVKNVQWLIKIHPHEVSHKTPYSVEKVIQEHFKALPKHIKIIKADSKINVVDFMDLIDGGITVFGTLGLEMLIARKQMILAGNAFYANKGFTLDAKNIEDYKRLLSNIHLIDRLSEQQHQSVLKYAYYYLLSRQIPLNIFQHDDPNKFCLNWQKLNSLNPGQDLGLDLLCNGLVSKSPIELDEDFVHF